MAEPELRDPVLVLWALISTYHKASIDAAGYATFDTQSTRGYTYFGLRELPADCLERERHSRRGYNPYGSPQPPPFNDANFKFLKVSFSCEGFARAGTTYTDHNARFAPVLHKVTYSQTMRDWKVCRCVGV